MSGFSGPPPPRASTIMIGVFTPPGWGAVENWNGSAGTFTVTCRGSTARGNREADQHANTKPTPCNRPNANQ